MSRTIIPAKELPNVPAAWCALVEETARPILAGQGIVDPEHVSEIAVALILSRPALLGAVAEAAAAQRSKIVGDAITTLRAGDEWLFDPAPRALDVADLEAA